MVVSPDDDEGITGVSFGSAGSTPHHRSRLRPGQAVLPRAQPDGREQNAQEFRWFDRRWNHSPIYAYGPFDIACWDIAGRRPACRSTS
jgi:L-alanine-DL-glutamate epimerase-like enolase superfamily enzyme